MPYRIEKINDLIRDHLANIIEKDVSLSRDVFVSIAEVDTSKDLRYTRVLVSVFPENRRNYGMKTLQNELYRIQGQLNKKLTCKPLPKIKFISDEKGKRTDELEKIFDQIRKEKEQGTQ